ncbi:MAG: hypothetical protein ACKVS9_19665 [Phycisphaerae bacterium]
MLAKFGAVVLTGMALVLGSGCGMEMRVVAHRTETNKQWFGDMGITGHQNKVTIANGSRVQTLSIIGDGNELLVEDNCTLSKIEIFGENNRVSIPERLIIRDSIVGKGNTIERRPRVIDNSRPTPTRSMSVPEDQVPAGTSDAPIGGENSNTPPASDTSPAPSSPAPSGDGTGE